MTTDPGAPRTDELARNAALHVLSDAIGAEGYSAYAMGQDADPERVASGILDSHTVTWETDINSAGVSVRRYVLRGGWDVDPTAARQPVVATIGAAEPHPFVGTRYKGRDIDSCSHVTMTSSHTGSMCAAGADDPLHLSQPSLDPRPHCEVVDGPCPGNERGVICGAPCEEDQAVPTRVV